MSYVSQACLIGTAAAQHFSDFDLIQFTSTYKDDHYEGDNKNMCLTRAWILCHPINSAAIEEFSVCVFVSVGLAVMCVCTQV